MVRVRPGTLKKKSPVIQEITGLFFLIIAYLILLRLSLNFSDATGAFPPINFFSLKAHEEP